MMSLFDLEFEFGLMKKFLKVELGESKAETRLTLEGDVDEMGVLKFGFEIKVIFEVFWLPEVPNSDENFAFGFEVFLDLLENKKLIFLSGQVVDDGDTEDVIVLGKVLPDLFFSDIGFNEFLIRVRLFGFSKKLTADV